MKPFANNLKSNPTHGHHLMDNMEIKLSIYFACKNTYLTKQVKFGSSFGLDHELLLEKLQLKI